MIFHNFLAGINVRNNTVYNDVELFNTLFSFNKKNYIHTF